MSQLDIFRLDDRVALVAGSPSPAQRRQWTYAELLSDATRAAQGLLTSFEPGERYFFGHKIPKTP